jgi:copper(I)-binding protein
VRLPWPGLAGGGLAVLLGAIGLITAAVPQSSGAQPAMVSGSVTVSDAKVLVPQHGSHDTVGSFTVDNTTAHSDRVVYVQTGAGESAKLLSAAGKPLRSGVVVPAHGTLTLRPGGTHVSIGGIIGSLVAGQSVNVEVDLAHAGPVDVVAKVSPRGGK